MNKEKKIQQSDIDDTKVMLKPIAGVTPLVYLPILYAFLTLALLFVVFVYPGIRSGGSYLLFEGNPSTCAVYLNGDYKGSTVRKFFVAAGSYEMRLEKKGYASSTRKIVVGRRIFGSLFFPRITRLEFDLTAIDGAENLRQAFADYASWSLTGKPSALYQVPGVLAEAARDYFGTGLTAETKANAKTGTTASPLPFTVTNIVSDIMAATQSAESARDGLKAACILASAGSSTPLGLLATARVTLGVLGRDKSGGVWLKDTILKKSKRTADILAKIPATEIDVQVPAPKPQGFRALGPHDYLMFSSGSASMGGLAPSGSLAPYVLKVPAFGLARTEVTRSQWTAFLAANTEWKPENRSTLVEKGFVDASYLASWDKGQGDEPVTGVSWFAASAYCAWLTKSSGGTYAVRLPSEAMWETAAAAGRSEPSSFKEKRAVWAVNGSSGPSSVASLGYSSIGLADIFGNVWEWSSDSFLPYPAFASTLLDGTERTVRGGSWANTADKIDLHSRGGLAPSHSSLFLGFRTAIVQR